MREMDWPAPRPQSGVLIDKPALRASALAGLGCCLISGDLAAAVAALSPGAPLLGLGPVAPEAAYGLRLARDRALLVTAAPLVFDEGWRTAGWCASRLDDGVAILALSGPAVGDVVAQGTAVDLDAGSTSAALIFAGQRCALARTRSGLRLHCEACFREALIDWLVGAA